MTKTRRTFRLQADKVPKIVVRALALGHLIVRLGLHSVNDIGKLNGVLNKEDGDWGSCYDMHTPA